MWILKKRTNKSIFWSINHRRGKLNISISKWGSPSYVRDKKFNPKSSGAAIINIKSLGCVNIDKVLAFHESGTCASPPFCDFNKLHTGQHVLLLSLSHVGSVLFGIMSDHILSTLADREVNKKWYFDTLMWWIIDIRKMEYSWRWRTRRSVIEKLESLILVLKSSTHVATRGRKCVKTERAKNKLTSRQLGTRGKSIFSFPSRLINFPTWGPKYDLLQTTRGKGWFFRDVWLRLITWQIRDSR